MRLTAVLLLLVSSTLAQDEKKAQGLDLAINELPTLLTYEISKKGELRLNRDSWKEAVEEPEAAAPGGAENEDPDPALQLRLRMMARMGPRDSQMHNVLQRAMAAAGSNNAGAGRTGGGDSDGEFRGETVAGTYKTQKDWIHIFIDERVGNCLLYTSDAADE